MTEVKYCPYCGSAKLKIVKGMPRCMGCRTVFLVSYSRRVRQSPKKPREIGK